MSRTSVKEFIFSLAKKSPEGVKKIYVDEFERDDHPYILAYARHIPERWQEKIVFLFRDWQPDFKNPNKFVCLLWYDDRWIEGWKYIDPTG